MSGEVPELADQYGACFLQELAAGQVLPGLSGLAGAPGADVPDVGHGWVTMSGSLVDKGILRVRLSVAGAWLDS
jgi:hypothetical protein